MIELHALHSKLCVIINDMTRKQLLSSCISLPTEIQSMKKETEIIIKESSVSSSGSVNIPIYRVDLSL